jgi:hypothetical protein
MGPSPEELDDVFKLLDKTFTVSDEGTISDYLGIKVTTLPDGRMSFTQPQLIDSIITDCGLEKPNAKPRTTPALSTRIVRRDEDGEVLAGHQVEISISHWEIELSRKVYASGHSLRSSSVC